MKKNGLRSKREKSQTWPYTKMRNKTKCGLRRAHLCIWEKMFLREWERRKRKGFGNN